MDDLQELGLRIIEFDPARPQPEFFATATEMAAVLAAGLQAEPVSLPAHLAPTLDLPSTPPDPSDPLPPADVLIVTWTVAEAETLATLLSPGMSFGQWYQYKSNLDRYIPLVTGSRAPFNNQKSTRFFHSLGLYCPIQLAGKKIICLKSGLHLDHDTYNKDQPAPERLPMLDLWKQMISETQAKFIITTGTGGAIGADVLLGDVVVAAETVFDCTKQFAEKPFRKSPYPTSPLPASFAPPAAELLKKNADMVAESGDPQHPDGVPVIFYAGTAIANPKIVTTDTFAFDNTTNSAGLQGLGNACDMGDASLGLVVADIGEGAPDWAAIRNASDPQIDGTLTPSEQSDAAFKTYTKYGGLTSAASVLATWKLICSRYAVPALDAAMAPVTKTAVMSPSLALAQTRRREMRSSPTHLLLQMAAGSQFSSNDLTAAAVSAEVVQALHDTLIRIAIDPRRCGIVWRLTSFLDDAQTRILLHLCHVACDKPEAFRGSYLFSGTSLVAKEEFASGQAVY